MAEHQHVPGRFLREPVPRGEDRADDAVHVRGVGLLAHGIPEGSVGIREGVEDVGAERVALEGLESKRDDGFERLDVRILGVESSQYHQHLVQIGIRRQGLVLVAVGVSVIEIIVVLVGERRIAGVVAHEQRRVIVGRFGVHRPVEDQILIGGLSCGDCRDQQEQEQQFFHDGSFRYEREISANRICRSTF